MNHSAQLDEIEPSTSDFVFLNRLSVSERDHVLANVRRMSALSGWRSALTLTLLWVYLLILLTLAQNILVNEAAFDWLWLIPIWILLGGAQHGMLILMHDASHVRLFKDRVLNDVVSNTLLTYPLFVTTESYRHAHMPHHRYLNTERDPDMQRKVGKRMWTFPQSHGVWLGFVAAQLVGRGAWDLLGQLLRKKDLATESDSRGGAQTSALKTFLRLFYYLLIAAAAWRFELFPAVAFWLFTAFTTLPVFLHVRSVAEHFGLPWDSQTKSSRNVDPGILERLTVAPLHINLHLTHHLFPSVPWYRLPALHTFLKTVPAYREDVSNTSGYFSLGQRGLMAELSRSEMSLGESRN